MGGPYYDCEITYDYSVVFLSNFFDIYEIHDPELLKKHTDLYSNYNHNKEELEFQIEQLKDSVTMTWSQVESSVKDLEKQLEILKEKYEDEDDNISDQLDNSLVVYVPKLPNFAVNGQKYIRSEDYANAMHILGEKNEYKLYEPKNIPIDPIDAAKYLKEFYKDEEVRLSNAKEIDSKETDNKIHNYILSKIVKYNPEEQSFDEFKKKVEWYSKINLQTDPKEWNISFQYGSTKFEIDHGTRNIGYGFYDAGCKLEELEEERKRDTMYDDIPIPNWNDMFVFRNHEKKTLTDENGNVSIKHYYQSDAEFNSVLETFGVEFEGVEDSVEFLLES